MHGYLSPPALHGYHESLALWTAGSSVLNSLLQSLMVLWVSFCTGTEILHFFLTQSSNQEYCSDIFLNDMVMYFMTVLLAGGPFTGFLYSCFPRT